MEISRSFSQSSPLMSASAAEPIPAMRQPFGRKASSMSFRPSAVGGTSGARVTISSDARARAAQELEQQTQAQPAPWLGSDVMHWLVAIGLGVVIGWSAAGDFLVR